MYKHLHRIVTSRVGAVVVRVDSSNLRIGEKEIMTNSPNKYLELGRDFKLPNKPLEQPVRTKPHLF